MPSTAHMQSASYGTAVTSGTSTKCVRAPRLRCDPLQAPQLTLGPLQPSVRPDPQPPARRGCCRRNRKGGKLWRLGRSVWGHTQQCSEATSSSAFKGCSQFSAQGPTRCGDRTQGSCMRACAPACPMRRVHCHPQAFPGSVPSLLPALTITVPFLSGTQHSTSVYMSMFHARRASLYSWPLAECPVHGRCEISS